MARREGGLRDDARRRRHEGHRRGPRVGTRLGGRRRRFVRRARSERVARRHLRGRLRLGGVRARGCGRFRNRTRSRRSRRSSFAAPLHASGPRAARSPRGGDARGRGARRRRRGRRRPRRGRRVHLRSPTRRFAFRGRSRATQGTGFRAVPKGRVGIKTREGRERRARALGERRDARGGSHRRRGTSR